MDYYENYHNLANAIVIQAFKDYKRVLRHTQRYPHDAKANFEKKQLERFFLGEKISMFTAVDGKYLIETAKKQVAKNA